MGETVALLRALQIFSVQGRPDLRHFSPALVVQEPDFCRRRAPGVAAARGRDGGGGGGLLGPLAPLGGPVVDGYASSPAPVARVLDLGARANGGRRTSGPGRPGLRVQLPTDEAVAAAALPAGGPGASWLAPSQVFPRTLLLHGSRDTTVPLEESVLFHQALESQGVPVDLKQYRRAARQEKPSSAPPLA